LVIARSSIDHTQQCKLGKLGSRSATILESGELRWLLKQSYLNAHDRTERSGFPLNLHQSLYCGLQRISMPATEPFGRRYPTRRTAIVTI
jgi:hypothetical protein